MNLWLNRLSAPVPAGLKRPADTARFELDHAGLNADLTEDPSMGDAYRIERNPEGVFLLTGGQTGLLYGSYRLITANLCGEQLPFPYASAPKYALRMINCWDNMDGSVERGYAGQSLFFENGRVVYSPDRMRRPSGPGGRIPLPGSMQPFRTWPGSWSRRTAKAVPAPLPTAGTTPTARTCWPRP